MLRGERNRYLLGAKEGQVLRARKIGERVACRAPAVKSSPIGNESGPPRLYHADKDTPHEMSLPPQTSRNLLP